MALLWQRGARSLSVDGVLIEPGENLLEDSRTVQALVWIESDVAPQIMTGMPAVINVAVADGEADELAGEVSKFSAVPWPGDADAPCVGGADVRAPGRCRPRRKH